MCGACSPARSALHDVSSGFRGRRKGGAWLWHAAPDRGVCRTSPHQHCASGTAYAFTQSTYVSHEVHLRSLKRPLLLKAG
jgi:hypothetical protein